MNQLFIKIVFLFITIFVASCNDMPDKEKIAKRLEDVHFFENFQKEYVGKTITDFRLVDNQNLIIVLNDMDTLHINVSGNGYVGFLELNDMCFDDLKNFNRHQ